MKQLTDIELTKQQVLKAVRNAVRLRHSLAADRELNEVLPSVALEFEAAVKSGEVYELDVADFLREQA